MKWIPQTKPKAISQFKKRLDEMKSSFMIPLDISEKLPSRIAVSGDISGIPIYHFRWKFKILPDLIIWPTENEHISAILKLASEFTIPVTIRAGGTCYFGSSVSTMGGVVLDTKRMDCCSVDIPNKTLRVQAGATFGAIMKVLIKTKLSLPAYPSSFKSATFGGWFSSNNDYGIGTFTRGPFYTHIKELTVITPNGKIQKTMDNEKIKLFSNSIGTLGFISEMKIQLIDKMNTTAYTFSFEKQRNPSNIFISVQEIASKYQTTILSFGDSIYQEEFHVIMFIESLNQTIDVILIESVESLGGKYLGDEISENIKNQIHRLEMFPKSPTNILLFQTLTIKLKNMNQIIFEFKTQCDKYKISNYYFNTMLSRNDEIRIMLYITTNNLDWMHFLSSKAILHNMTKLSYSCQGKVHTYGMQNTMYLHKYELERLKLKKEQKLEYDDQLIMNPLKIIQTKISFARVETMFRTALFFRTIQVKLRLKNDKENEFLNKNSKDKPPWEYKQCISCGMCRENCPNYRLLQSEEFTACGRNRIMRYYTELGIPLDNDCIAPLFTCTTCNQCAKNCPVSYDFATHLEKIREFGNNYFHSK